MLLVFDFDRRWAEVAPLLNRPLAQRALNAGMKSYVAAPGRPAWEPSIGPWRYTRNDHWVQRADELTEDSPEWLAYAESRGLWDEDEYTDEDRRIYYQISRQFDPQPDTPDWYRCYGACHWLAGWCCAIGRLLMPSRQWYVLTTTEHSNAIGFGLADDVIMDILLGHRHSPAHLWQSMRGGNCVTLEDEVAYRESGERSPRLEVPLREVRGQLLSIKNGEVRWQTSGVCDLTN